MNLICNGELVNEHSKNWDGSWSNPLDDIPQIGSIIDYKGFRNVFNSYKVISTRFSTEEASNNSYENKICIIELEKL